MGVRGKPAHVCRALTVNASILRRGGDPPALNLDVFPTGAAVELVDPDLSAAQLVRGCALRPHMLLKIRRRVILPLFMQKGKIKYVTVLLSNRKLQPRSRVSPAKPVCFSPPRTRVRVCLPEPGTTAPENGLICKQRSGLRLESASGNFESTSLARRVRSSHVHAAPLDPLHGLCGLRTRTKTCPSRLREGSDPRPGLSPHVSELESRGAPRTRRETRVHHSEEAADIPSFT